MRKTVFWAAFFALAFALAIGGCDLLPKGTDEPQVVRKTPEDSPNDTAVYADFSVSANGNSGKGETTTRLELSFSQTVAGLTADNITLIDEDGTGIGGKGAGSLWRLDDAAKYYALAVGGIRGSGYVTVEVATPAVYKWLPFGEQKARRRVHVNAPKIAVRFIGVLANGSSEKGETTTRLTLTFNKAVPGLTAENITLTDGWEQSGIQKGALSKANDGTGDYMLAVSGINKAGWVSVKVALPTGFCFLDWGSEYSVRVYGTE